METEAEKEAERQLKTYAEAAQGNAGVNKAVLAMAAMEAAQNADRITAKKKRWAYLLSFGLPPLGLIFAAWYYFSPKLGAKRMALVCLILTVLGGLLLWLSLAAILKSAPVGTLQQIQSLRPEDINSLLQ